MARRIQRRRQDERNPFLQKAKKKYIKKGLNFRRRQRKINISDFQWKILILVEAVCVIGLAFLLVEAFGIRVQVIGESMEPTLADGDVVMINRLGTDFFSPKRGVMVVYVPGGSEDAAPTVKRVIALPHDRVRIENGAIYINDSIYEESMAKDYIEEAGLAATEITLGKGEYFCLGDNRNNSQDSRYESVGNIRRRDMLGTVWLLCGGSGFGVVQ